MVDTFRPLELGEGGVAVDDGKYAWSWAGRGPADTAADGPAADGDSGPLTIG
jgi:homogentisate 1,2-dioxygenase